MRWQSREYSPGTESARRKAERSPPCPSPAASRGLRMGSARPGAAPARGWSPSRAGSWGRDGAGGRPALPVPVPVPVPPSLTAAARAPLRSAPAAPPSGHRAPAPPPRTATAPPLGTARCSARSLLVACHSNLYKTEAFDTEGILALSQAL